MCGAKVKSGGGGAHVPWSGGPRAPLLGWGPDMSSIWLSFNSQPFTIPQLYFYPKSSNIKFILKISCENYIQEKIKWPDNIFLSENFHETLTTLMCYLFFLNLRYLFQNSITNFYLKFAEYIWKKYKSVLQGCPKCSNTFLVKINETTFQKIILKLHFKKCIQLLKNTLYYV